VSGQTATVGGTLDSMLDADLGDSASPVIVIRGGAMNPGETYVLRCDVLFRDAGATTGGASGSATVTALVNSPPSGGRAFHSSISQLKLSPFSAQAKPFWCL